MCDEKNPRWGGENNFATSNEVKINGIIDTAYIQVNTENSILGTALDDIAIYTNCEIIKDDKGWKKIKRQDLGETKQVIISNTKTLFIRDEEKKSFWNSVTYHNLVTRVLKSKKHRPSYTDYYSGWCEFNKLIDLLDVIHKGPVVN
mgnify:CR=1 FL=1